METTKYAGADINPLETNGHGNVGDKWGTLNNFLIDSKSQICALFDSVLRFSQIVFVTNRARLQKLVYTSAPLTCCAVRVWCVFEVHFHGPSKKGGGWGSSMIPNVCA